MAYFPNLGNHSNVLHFKKDIISKVLYKHNLTVYKTVTLVVFFFFLLSMISRSHQNFLNSSVRRSDIIQVDLLTAVLLATHVPQSSHLLNGERKAPALR